jgi:PAS domain-containing protein
MGGASSIGNAKDSVYPNVFLSAENLEARKKLLADEKLQKSFTEYVKTKAWVPYLAVFQPVLAQPGALPASSGFVMEKNLFPYQIPMEKLAEAECSGLGAALPKESAKYVQKMDSSAILELYASVEDCISFSSAQLCCIMFAVVYPIYAAHVNDQGGASQQREKISRIVTGLMQPGMMQTKQSHRAQDVLLSCATQFDQFLMLETIEKDWTGAISATFNHHALAISIVDTSKADLPFIYVNRSFEKLFEYPCAGILGKSFRILNGENTEDFQLSRILEAFKSPQSVKTYITHYTAAKKRVLDLIAVQSVGTWALCVHFAAAGADIVQLKVHNFILHLPARYSEFSFFICDYARVQMVDDLLILMSQLVQPAPPAAKTQSSFFGSLRLSLLHPSGSGAVLGPQSARSTAAGSDILAGSSSVSTSRRSARATINGGAGSRKIAFTASPAPQGATAATPPADSADASLVKQGYNRNSSVSVETVRDG